MKSSKIIISIIFSITTLATSFIPLIKAMNKEEPEAAPKSLISLLPSELKLYILSEHGLRSIIENNSIFDPFQGVGEYIRNIALTSSDFRNFSTILDFAAEKIAKKYFAPEESKLSENELDEQLEKIAASALIKAEALQFGSDPEWEATLNNIEQQIARLIIAGANPNLKIIETKVAGLTAPINEPILNIVISLKANKLIPLLIFYGANIEKKGNAGRTPLLLAAHNNNLDAMKELLKYKPNVNAQNDFGLTALIYSADHGNREAVELLLENDALNQYEQQNKQ